MFGVMCCHLMTLMILFNLCFTTVLEGLLDFLVPLRKIRIKQSVNPWATGGDITAARHHTDGLYRRALLSGCQSDWKLFRDARNRVNGLLRSAKRRYIEELISMHGGHPSKFWSHFGYKLCLLKGESQNLLLILIFMLMI